MDKRPVSGCAALSSSRPSLLAGRKKARLLHPCLTALLQKSRHFNPKRGTLPRPDANGYAVSLPAAPFSCEHPMRQREKRQHEKNLREGKRKPWAPPPPPRNEEERRGASPPARSKKAQPKPKPPGQGGSAHFAKDGPVRPGRSSKPGPGGRRLSGKFRHNP